MEEDLKEILDRLFVYRNENDEMKYEPEDMLITEDIWLLLDYITNLQQENQILKENAIHNDKVVDKARWNETIYKSRIDKAIKHIEDKMELRKECPIELLNILKEDGENEER